VDAAVDRLGTSGLDRRQPIGEHGGQDIDHLSITVIDALLSSVDFLPCAVER
jgi:hypothetical protein